MAIKLQPLRLCDKVIFEKVFSQSNHELCGYAFENIFIWRRLFEITWSRVNKNICIFFTDKTGCFMPLPPLGKFDEKTIKECFCIMENINHNCDISRIENIEENMLSLFKMIGCRFYEKSREYVILRDDAALLKGDKFKHKRNLYNYHSKNFKSIFRDFVVKDREAVLALYQEWMAQRSNRYADPVYCALLNDSFKAFCEMLKHIKRLDIKAKVVECNGKIRSFTSGFGLNKNLFCINFEIADLELKGLSVFTFCEFAKTLKPYLGINIMDDCGIESLRHSKEIWKPVRKIASYTALFGS